MVRSYWIGPLFGVLALTGLARSQTPTPNLPAPASDSKERFVTVGDLGKPGEKCRVLKTWTMPNGNPAYQVQAVDTGELMTIEESESASKRTPGAVVRPSGMRIFHWGGDAKAAPHGSPQPPANAVVLAQPSEVHSTKIAAPVAAAVPEKPQVKWPPAFADQQPKETVLLPSEKRATPGTPPVVKNIELTPLRQSPVGPKPAPVVPSKSPYNQVTAPAPVVTAAELKPANPNSWSAATAGKTTAPTQAPAKSPEPTAAKKPPTTTAKVETTPAKPSDWRESWGKIPAPKSAPLPLEERMATKVAPKVDLPHAQVKTDDPLSTPEKFAAMPKASAADTVESTTSKETKRPFLALFAANPPAPPAQTEEKKPERPAATIPPPPPVPVSPVAPVKPAEIAPPIVRIAPPAAAQLTPPAAAKASPTASAPIAADVKPDAKPTVPLGMQSVLAARSPELAPPVPQKPAGASQSQAMGIDANEANAFTEPPAGGKSAIASNGFWAPKKSAPAAYPQPDAMAWRPMPPSAGYAPAPMAAPPVTQAAYRQETSPELSQLSVVMRESLYPSQREWAAERLAAFDWRRQPQALELLMERAKLDPAATVRAECVRSLGHMTSDAPGVVEAVKSCRSDADSRVRQQADDALATLTGR